MTFKTGTLANPVTVVKLHPDVVLDARLASADPFERVFVKLLDENRRCIEAVAAWIAQDVGLPSPAARFTNVHRSKIRGKCEWRFAGRDEIVAFSTVAVENAVQLIKLESSVVALRLLRWKYLELAAVFDQLIANDDRSEGNMLMDGRGTFWLIDHARSLGGGGQRLFSTEVMPSIRNFLLDKLRTLPMGDRMKRRDALTRACVELSSRVSRIPYAGLLVPEQISIQVDIFLSQRARVLQAMVLDAVGLPDLYQDPDFPRLSQ